RSLHLVGGQSHRSSDGDSDHRHGACLGRAHRRARLTSTRSRARECARLRFTKSRCDRDFVKRTEILTRAPWRACRHRGRLRWRRVMPGNVAVIPTGVTRHFVEQCVRSAPMDDYRLSDDHTARDRLERALEYAHRNYRWSAEEEIAEQVKAKAK